jgi:hypothetical protein
MRMELSITRSVVHSVAAFGCTRFAAWQRHVARRRLRQLRLRRLSLA